MTVSDESTCASEASLGESEARPAPTYNSLAAILALATTAVDRMTPDD